jgi:glucokinase
MFDMGKRALKECGLVVPARVGISFGGPVSNDRKEVLMSCHITDWEGIPLPKLAREAFKCPARMDNDANVAALGSWYFDAHCEPENMIYIQVSTGIGSGLILNRKLFRGGGIAGEIGHITVIPDGPKCVCGKRGCLESLCAGWAIARDGREALDNASKESTLYQLCQGDPLKIDAQLLIQAARKGDSKANAIINKAFTALGIAIANVITLFDPQVIMLGGGITNAESEMRKVLDPVITRELYPPFKGRYKLQFSHLDGKETLLGAALLYE